MDSCTSIIMDRYERNAISLVRDLKKLHAEIVSLEEDGLLSYRPRGEARLVEDQLLSGLQQILKLRESLNETAQEEFDTRLEPVRKQIQIAVNMMMQLPKPSSSSNPFEEAYEEGISGRSEQKQLHEDLREKMVAAKEKAEATNKISQDVEDLNKIMQDLALLVHAQQDQVDSIEDHVERAVHEVNEGSRHVKRAVASNSAKYPMVAAAVGGLAAGGPVGVVAGSAVAGVIAAVAGAIGGLYGGRALRNRTVRDAES